MKATYTNGDIFRHIFIMTGSGTIGLAAMFAVDLVDMYFLSLLDDIAVTAAVGFAVSILFFTLSMNIGLSIGCGALVSIAAGKGEKVKASRQVTHILILCVSLSVLSAAIILSQSERILTWLGADGQTLIYAQQYLTIVLCSMPIMSIAMLCSAVIRALGDAKNAMGLTLIAALVNAVLDPIFIFALDLGIQGAAYATVCARVAMGLFGLWIVLQKFQLVGKPDFSVFKQDCKHFSKIAFPAVLTNLATPISVAYITAVIAQFGDDAVSGHAIVSRIQQVAFSGMFALSGAVGTIAGQNWGAEQYERVKATLDKSLLFIIGYCGAVCLILFLCTNLLISAFGAEGTEADLIRWFCWGFSAMWIFNGATFATNALFNNLGVAHYATLFNFGKATLGTMPFVYFGAQLAGPFGIYFGALTGAGVVAVLGVWMNYRHISGLPEKPHLLNN